MGRRLRAVLSLSWRDRWVLWQAWVLLLAVDLALRVWPFRRVQIMLATGQRKVMPDLAVHEASPIIQRLARLVRVAANNHLYPMRCMPRSLVLQWLLGRRGVDAQLRFGVQRNETGIAAHAWLEHRGRPIGEPEGIEARFMPLVSADDVR